MSEPIKVCDRYEYQSPIAVASRFDPETGGVKYERKYSSIQKDWFCVDSYDEKNALKILETGKKRLTRERTQLKLVRWTGERKWTFTRDHLKGVGRTYGEALANLRHWESQWAYWKQHVPE